MSERARSWGSGLLARGFAAVFGLSVAAMLVETWMAPAWDGRLEFSIGFGAIAVITAWWTLWPRVVLTDDELVIRNPMRTTRVPLTELIASRAGRDGLVVVRTDGVETSAWAVQKSPLMGLLRRRTRGDLIAREIADTAARAWTAAGLEPPTGLRRSHLGEPGPTGDTAPEAG